MVRKVLIYLVMLIICSCSNTKILADGTKVLSKTYENRKYFNSETDGLIDPNCFYKQIDYYIADSNYKKMRDIGRTQTDVNIQFYNNGCIRILLYKDGNPNNTGRRGVIYMKNNSLKIDTQFSDQNGNISKGTYSVNVQGDKLFLLDNNFLFTRTEYFCKVFEKSEKIPEDWKQYKADW